MQQKHPQMRHEIARHAIVRVVYSIFMRILRDRSIEMGFTYRGNLLDPTQLACRYPHCTGDRSGCDSVQLGLAGWSMP